MRIETHSGEPPQPNPRRKRGDFGLADVLALISRERDIPIRLLVHVSRCRAETARARQVAMYLAHVVKGVSLTAIGSAFGRDRTTVSYACGLIEDMRDDPGFDAELDRLEALLNETREH
ncbi:chromosomal replication initiator DnaA [Devosia sp. BK]|uniref:helix-turn-helix domain-containing protein n=1 Tax=Devosia sp. BK TaxID=2871706 RepID=UPI002939D0CF|nr:helix-turn-helix domain-containing protein [Devosia sp. BK]MDV3251581.1 chromosomal replication initiator DnaA [Devosia sp. BK]